MGQIRRHPTLIGKIITPTWNGTEQIVDETPALLDAVRRCEMQAAMSCGQPLGQDATFADFLRECPERNARTFALWGTRHQVDPRTMVQIQLEAQANKLDLEPVMEPDPLDRQAIPLVDDEESFDADDSAYPEMPDADIDRMRVSGSTTLRELQRLGVIKRNMNAEQLYARLRRLGLDEHDIARKTIKASLGGFFLSDYIGANRLGYPMAPDRANVGYTEPWTRRNGDTLRERADDTPVIRDIQSLLARAKAMACRSDIEMSGSRGRVIKATAEGC